MHFATPAIAAEDATVAQGLRYPQRYVPFDERLAVGQLSDHEFL